MAAMKPVIFCAALLLGTNLWAQAPAASNPQLDALNKKADEINTKLDSLSQQLLKMEQQMGRPGVIVGEATPAPMPTATTTVAAAVPVAPAGSSNTHVVAKGETLTSIAKQYKVSVEDLQKFNHIEDGRKLQAGQSVMIPSASPSATASPSP